MLMVLIHNSLLMALKPNAGLPHSVSQGVVPLHSDGPGRYFKMQIPGCHSRSVKSESLRLTHASSQVHQVILMPVVYGTLRKAPLKCSAGLPYALAN